MLLNREAASEYLENHEGELAGFVVHEIIHIVVMGEKAWNPGAVFLGSDTTWEQCRGGGSVVRAAPLKTDFCNPPQLRHFGVLIASIEGAKGPYEATALKST